MIRDQVTALVKQALQAVNIDDTPHLTHPANPDFGDYATNVALKHAKRLGKKPSDLASEIIAKLPNDALIQNAIQINGFINLTLSPTLLLNDLKKAPDPKKTSKTILVEYGQPNTHKSPHIGHLFSYIYGESLARILEAAGNTVIRANYQGDIGLHVAKCLWSVRKQSETVQTLSDATERMQFLQHCYQDGATAYEDDEAAKKDIDQLNKDLYIASDTELMSLWKETRQWCVDYYKVFEEQLGIAYDRSYFETEIADLGKQVVTDNTPAVFQESDGATIFPGEDYDLHTRVFINRFGNPTYEGKELGLAFQKKEDFPFDQSITTTASEQNEYMKVVYKAIEQINPELSSKLFHIGFGMIQLSSGKMSSRTGNIITAFSLVDDVTTAIKDTFQSSLSDAKHIALGAIKYAFLKSDARANKTFDIETSIAKEGDSGPYLMYTYVRTQGIRNNTELTHLNDVSDKWGSVVEAYEPVSEEVALLRLLPQFPEIVEQAAATYAPHHIAHYAFELAQAFNHFYQECPIAKADTATQQVRLAIVTKTAHILKESLRLLGIETIDTM